MSCFDCAQPSAHDHHVVPLVLGGRQTVPLCERCHGLVHDRDMTSHRTLTIAGIRRTQQAGMFTGGRTPYGFVQRLDGQLVPDGGESATIAEARRLRVSGLSLRKVAEQLHAIGMRSRSGDVFAATQVARMCKEAA